MSSTDPTHRPKVGVGVVVCRDNKILVGKRIGSHGAGTWNFPGGHLEFGEEIFDCAKREVAEETGLTITNLRLGPYTNDCNRKENNHYITLFVIADAVAGEAKVMEPESCAEWRWVKIDEVPTPIFLPTQHFLETGFKFFQENR